MSMLCFQSAVARNASAAVAAFSLLALTGCGSGVRSVTGGGATSVALLAVSAAPRLGYAWSQADKTLRPILGIPGAAQFGAAVTAAGTYEGGAAEPAGTYAILLGDSQAIYRVSLPDGTATRLNGKAPGGSTVVFAPRGDTALVYGPGGLAGLIVGGTAGATQVRTVTFSAPALDAAISDTGTVAVAQRSGSGVSVQVLPATGNAVVLPALNSGGGLGFVPNTEDLLLADGSTNDLFLVRAASTAPVRSAVSTGGLLKSPVSLAASRNGHWAVVASSGDSSAARIDLTGVLSPQRTACSCQPSTVAPLSGDGAFRLTPLETGTPVWISDASRASFPVLFVPALKAGM